MGKRWQFLLPAIAGIVMLSILGVNALRSRQDAPVMRPAESHTIPDLPAPPPTAPHPPRRSLDTYVAAGQGKLFGAPPVPETPPVVPAPSPPPRSVPPANPPPAPPPPPAPEDPLQNFTYTGYAAGAERSYALLEDNRTHEGTWLGEGDTFQGYTIEHIDATGVRLRQGTTVRTLAINDHYNVVPLAREAPKDVLPNPGSLTQYRGKVGMSFYFQVTGRLTGSVWGSGPYTDDSDLGTAAVHAGVLRDGQQGVVRVTILPGASRYDGSIRNGVTSNNYATWEGSYRVDR